MSCRHSRPLRSIEGGVLKMRTDMGSVLVDDEDFLHHSGGSVRPLR
ncbi:hypothetical protein AB0873_31170 [Micromonospora sp. NPDC047707]